MTYPNSLVDARPDVWGWPWHGMIEGTPSTDRTPSELILPSGARMECAWRAGDAHNTHLWDIGMPVPEVETENPDERWLNKAIIRSRYSGDDRKSAFCYSGDLAFESGHPMHVPGVGTLIRRLEMSQRTSGGVANIVVTLFVSNKLSVELPLSRSQLKLPDAGAFSRRLPDFRVQLMDESPNGRSALYWIAPRVFSFGTEYLALGRTLLEITITGDPKEGFGLTHRIVEPYSVQVDSQQHPPGTHSQGTVTKYSMVETPIWAWYSPDGSVEVIRYRSEGHFTETYLSTSNTQDYASSARQIITLGSLAGQVSKEYETELVQHLTRIDPVWNRISSSYSVHVYGEQVYSLDNSETTSNDISTTIGGDPEVADPNPTLQAGVYPDGMIVLSNNILATIQRSFTMTGSGPTHWWCGDALSPAGIDHGLHKFDTANPGGGQVGYFQTGSYNPITGELVRNRPDKFCSWV